MNLTDQSVFNETDMDQEKIGIVTACMNRASPLSVSLSSWIIEPLIHEIIIVDWNSKLPLRNFESLDPRIKVVRVDGESTFNLGRAFNLGFAKSSCEKIMKMDSDYIINPYYRLTSAIPKPKNCFYTGNWQLYKYDGNMGFLRYTNGFIYVDKQSFVNVGGYREDLKGYGFDDTDLYIRLAKSGLQHKTLNLNKLPLLFHIPHDNKFRTENYDTKDISCSSSENQARCLSTLNTVTPPNGKQTQENA